MLKNLIFLPALLAPSLAYGGNPSAGSSLQIVPAGPVPAVPAPAQAAGFTTLAFNTDFTQPMPSNWLGCRPQNDSSGALWWAGHWFSGDQSVLLCAPGNPGVPTSYINIVTDPVYGGTVLDLTWPCCYRDPGGSYTTDHGANTITTTSADGMAGTHFPIFNRYEEIVFRVQTTPDIPNSTPPGASNPWTMVGGSWFDQYSWTTDSAKAGSNIAGFEENNFENHGDFPWYQSGGGCFNWIGTGQFCNGTGYAGLPQPYDPRQYHTAGFRITSDGSTGIGMCAYVDGVSRGCSSYSTTISAAQFAKRQMALIENGQGCNYRYGDNTCQNAPITNVYACKTGLSLYSQTQMAGLICVSNNHSPFSDAGATWIGEPANRPYISISGVQGVPQANGVWITERADSTGYNYVLMGSAWPAGSTYSSGTGTWNPFTQTDMYIRSFRVWSCSDWNKAGAPGECNGQILTTP